MLVSPGYQYESVLRDIFLTRAEIQKKFRRVLEISKKYRLTSTPMFLEFAAGLRDYVCSPWSTVTYTPRGWKGPCYLIGRPDSFDWNEFWNGTDWGYWESREDPLPELRDALGLRGLRGSRAAEAAGRHAPPGGLEPAGLAQIPRFHRLRRWTSSPAAPVSSARTSCARFSRGAATCAASCARAAGGATSRGFASRPSSET